MKKNIFNFGKGYPFPYKCPWCGGWNKTDEIIKELCYRFWICRKCGIRTFTNYNPNKRRHKQIEKAIGRTNR